MSSDILSAIAAYKRIEVAERMARRPKEAIEAAAKVATAPRGFLDALQRNRRPDGLALIAEVKKASPSKGLIRSDFDPRAIAIAYEAGGAACLSVLTDTPSFMGRDDYLTIARDASRLPCLRKDFMVDTWQIAESRALGADAILIILAIADDSLAAELLAEARRWGMDALVETHDAVEVDRAIALGATMIGINNRNLRTFVTDLAVTENLAQKIPATSLVITESGIFDHADAGRMRRAGAAAMLVGESLMRHPGVETATRRLLA